MAHPITPPPQNPTTPKPHHPTTLLLLKGHPATGKTALAEALVAALGWPLIDKDDVKDFTLELPDGNQLAYRIMWQIAARQLALGLSVIVDSPLSYPESYATGQALAAQHGARLLVVETWLPDDEWRRRLDARPVDASTHKIRGWDRMQAQLAAYNGCWQYPIDPSHHLRVDTRREVGENVREIKARLEQQDRKNKSED
jgi:predicted kinase